MLALRWCQKALRGGRECTPSSPPVSPWRRRGTAEGKRGERGREGGRETEQGKKERREERWREEKGGGDDGGGGRG